MDKNNEFCNDLPLQCFLFFIFFFISILVVILNQRDILFGVDK